MSATDIIDLPSESAIQYTNFQTAAAALQTKYGLSNGDVISVEQANEFLSYLGREATHDKTGTSNGDLLFYNLGTYKGIFGGDGSSPSSPNVTHLQIPKENVNADTDLYIISTSSSTSGDREMWVTDGDPEASFEYIEPFMGSQTWTDNNTTTVRAYRLPELTNNLWISMSRQVIVDILFIDRGQTSYAKLTSNLVSNGVPIATKVVSENRGLSHGITLSLNDANSIAQGISVGAYFRNDQGRTMPRLGTNSDNFGFWSPTTGAGVNPELDGQDALVELIIPKGNLTAEDYIHIRHGNTTSQENQDVLVYSGDPIGGSGTLLTPSYGTQSVGDLVTDVDNTSWDVLADLTATHVTEDLHIILRSATVFSLAILKKADKHPAPEEQSLFINVSEEGSLDFRGANSSYKGGITITKEETGVYQIIPNDYAGHVFGSNNTHVQATTQGYTGNPKTISYNYGAGYLLIHTLNSSTGEAIDSAFDLDMYW